MCTRGDLITRADLAIERRPACRAEPSCDDADELIIVSRGPDTEIVELVRRTIAALPAARRVEPCVELFGGHSLDDAVVVESLCERARPRR